MSHAAGQPAHRLHLLGLQELGLQGLAGCDVEEYPADIVNLTGGIAEYLPLGLNPGNLAGLFSGGDIPGRRICRS